MQELCYVILTFCSGERFTLSLQAHMQDSAGIMDNVCKLVPSLRDAKVVREWVGLRPYREPVRLELQHHEVLHQCSCTNACRLAPLAWCKSLQSS